MLSAGAWLLVASGIGAVTRAATTPLADSPQGVVTLRKPAPVLGAPRSYPADSLAAVAVARDVFRSERRPASAPYDPSRAADGPPSATPAPKPVLILDGVVWAAVPQAVVEGLPGANGPRVVRVGDRVGWLQVKRIERSRVVIAGMDTVWALTLRQSWR